jgi:hypothetical protein
MEIQFEEKKLQWNYPITFIFSDRDTCFPSLQHNCKIIY